MDTGDAFLWCSSSPSHLGVAGGHRFRTHTLRGLGDMLSLGSSVTAAAGLALPCSARPCCADGRGRACMHVDAFSLQVPAPATGESLRRWGYVPLGSNGPRRTAFPPPPPSSIHPVALSPKPRHPPVQNLPELLTPQNTTTFWICSLLFSYINSNQPWLLSRNSGFSASRILSSVRLWPAALEGANSLACPPPLCSLERPVTLLEPLGLGVAGACCSPESCEW